MTTWVSAVTDISDLLLDRQIFDVDGCPVGKVDDVEFTQPQDDVGSNGPPVLTALLCGPTAYGPRLGGGLGLWWFSVARRLRPGDDPNPVRIPMEVVTVVDRKQIQLSVTADTLGTDWLRDWVRDKVVVQIPGSGHEVR